MEVFMRTAIEEVLKTLIKGDLVIINDDLETQLSYLMGLADEVTGNKVNFMTQIGRGLVYVCISHYKAKKFNLPLMCSKHNSKKNFTVSIDFKSTTTGISTFERSDTIKALTDNNSTPEDFKRPGHVFPLIVSENGVLDYMGAAEASVDLARLCPGSSQITYLCEILNNKGDLAGQLEIDEISKMYNIPQIKITDLFKLRKSETICTLIGEVIQGNRIGNKLGYPTANLGFLTTDKLIKNGVYGVQVFHQGKEYLGVMNVGVKPTFNNPNQTKSYEIYILDFNYSIYGENLKANVKFFLRQEKKFNSLSELITQIEKDVEEVKYKFDLQKETINLG